MGKGGGGSMPAQPSYEKGLEEALKAQVGLLKGTGGFAEIAPEGLAGLVPLEAEVRQLSTQADTDAIQRAILGGFTVADADGRVIKAYSEDPMEGGSNWDKWAPTVQQDMETALDEVWEMGHHGQKVIKGGGWGRPGETIDFSDSSGLRLLAQMGYDVDEGLPGGSGWSKDVDAEINRFFKDSGWDKGEVSRRIQGTIEGGGYDAKAGYERAVTAGADVPRQPIYDEKTYEPGQKVRDPLQPGLVDLLGSSEAVTEGRDPAEQRRYEELQQSGQVRIRNGREVADFTEEEQAEWDTLKGIGDPTTRRPGFDENDEFLGLSKLGEDLRIQGASAGRAADIADIEANMAQFQAIMEKVRPETTQMLDDAVKVVAEQGKRLAGTPPSFEKWMEGREPGTAAGGLSDQQLYDELVSSGELSGGGFSISDPESMEDLAVSIQRSTALPSTFQEWVEKGKPGSPPVDPNADPRTLPTDQEVYDELRAGGELRGLHGYAEFTGTDPLRATLLSQADADLTAGRGLSERQRTDAIQATREGWEARGRVRDPAAVVAEVEAVMEAQGAEEARRRAFAGDVLAREAGLQTGELGRGMAQEEYNIGQEIARQEANIGRRMSAGMTDVGTTMDQERLNEQLRQQGILGYMAGTTQLAALEDAQQQKLDPFQAILGRPSSSGVPGFGMGQQIGGSAQYGLTAGPQYVSPESGLGYIQSQAANQANMWAAQQQAKATQSAGLMGALGSIGGGIATGYLSK